MSSTDPVGVPPEPEVNVAELARGVDALERRVIDLANTVADLANEVAERGKQPDEDPAPTWLGLPFAPRPPAEASDPDAPSDRQPTAAHDQAPDPRVAVTLLDELTTWMARVYLRYPDGAETLPQCWLWHPAIVEELVVLMCNWHDAYLAESASARLAGDWHDRYRPGVARRIGVYARGCSLEKHRPSGGSEPAGSAEPDPGEPVACVDSAESMARWWAGAEDRRPTPTDAHLAAAAARWSRHRDARR